MQKSQSYKIFPTWKSFCNKIPILNCLKVQKAALHNDIEKEKADTILKFLYCDFAET